MVGKTHTTTANYESARDKPYTIVKRTKCTVTDQRGNRYKLCAIEAGEPEMFYTRRGRHAGATFVMALLDDEDD